MKVSCSVAGTPDKSNCFYQGGFCHDFRVTFCTMCYEAGVPVKTLQVWMGHSDATMIMKVYAKLTAEKEQLDATKLNDFTQNRFTS